MSTEPVVMRWARGAGWRRREVIACWEGGGRRRGKKRVRGRGRGRGEKKVGGK